MRLHAVLSWEYQRKESEGDLEGDDPRAMVPGAMLLSDERSEVQRGASQNFWITGQPENRWWDIVMPKIE